VLDAPARTSWCARAGLCTARRLDANAHQLVRGRAAAPGATRRLDGSTPARTSWCARAGPCATRRLDAHKGLGKPLDGLARPRAVLPAANALRPSRGFPEALAGYAPARRRIAGAPEHRKPLGRPQRTVRLCRLSQSPEV